MLKRNLFLMFFAVSIFVCAAFALAGCAESKPWYGTYSMNSNYITVDEKTITSSSGSSISYTISGNIMTLENGAEFRFANDYQVMYSPLFSFLRHGNGPGSNTFTTRNGRLNGILTPNPLSEQPEMINFKPDGTYTYFKVGNVHNTYGNYTLNSGVLILYDFSTDGNDACFYIDENYDMYMYAYVKDINKFNFFPDESDLYPNGNNPGESNPGENNPGESEHIHQFGSVWEYDDTAHWKKCTCGETSGYAEHSFTAGECTTCGYKLEKFTVTLKWGIQGMPDAVTEMNKGATYTFPAASERAGYSFVGWRNTYYYGDTLSAGDTVTVTQNVVYYADWRLNEYKITFVTEHGEQPQPITFNVNNVKQIKLPVLEDEKLSFLHWTFDEKGEQKVETITELKDYTLYAVWLDIPPFHTGDIAHLELETGDFCPDCGLRLEYKTEDAALMISDEGEYGCGEYYGTTAGNQLDRYNLKINYIYISKTVTKISDSAFYDYGKLKTVSFEKDSMLASIGDRAFYNCNSLTSIEIPDGVTSIGGHAFHNCNSLTSIEIPDGVTSIGAYTFYDCNSLISIKISDGVNSIGYYAFENCSSLTNIVIPNSVTSIIDGAFYGCRKLASIGIPSGVTSIGDFAFYDCRKLASIVIPNSVTSIGDYAFYCCDSLKTVFYGGDVEAWNAIQIGSNNMQLLDNVYYYSPSAPEKAGKYWHYGNDGKTPEIWETTNNISTCFNFRKAKRHPITTD